MGALRGAWGLLLVLAATGFRARGRYWRWRHETAFGRGEPGRRDLRRAALDYGTWVTRMRSVGRAPASPLRGGSASHRR